MTHGYFGIITRLLVTHSARFNPHRTLASCGFGHIMMTCSHRICVVKDVVLKCFKLVFFSSVFNLYLDLGPNILYSSRLVIRVLLFLPWCLTAPVYTSKHDFCKSIKLPNIVVMVKWNGKQKKIQRFLSVHLIHFLVTLNIVAQENQSKQKKGWAAESGLGDHQRKWGSYQ